jgi:hypothetical protein
MEHRMRFLFMAGWLSVISGCVTDESEATSSGSGAGVQSDAEPALPLRAGYGSWIYSDIDGSQCRDGSPAGVGINRGSANKLLIYLEGGNWCLDESTCAANPSDTSAYVSLLGIATGALGIFDRSRFENPVRDWSFIYVPYCTGDLHAGANPEGMVPGVGPQKFVGYRNMQVFLKRIVATFPNVSELVLTGTSAGAYGAVFTSVLVQRAFPRVKVKLVADSGVPLSHAAYARCLQQRQLDYWAIDRTFLADCGAACPHADDYGLDYMAFVAASFADRTSGWMDSAGDKLLRSILGTGEKECSVPLDWANEGIERARYTAALLELRQGLAQFPNFGSFVPDADNHTWLFGYLPGVSGDVYVDRAGGVRAIEWFADLVHDKPRGNLGDIPFGP